MKSAKEITVTLLPDKDGVTPLRFDTKNGSVMVAIKPVGPGVAELHVYEMEAAKHGAKSLEGLAARNRFGASTILRILRFVRANTPHVKEWVIDRNSGANPDRARRALEV